jgi:hypothetical protein
MVVITAVETIAWCEWLSGVPDPRVVRGMGGSTGWIGLALCETKLVLRAILMVYLYSTFC